MPTLKRKTILFDDDSSEADDSEDESSYEDSSLGDFIVNSSEELDDEEFSCSVESDDDALVGAALQRKRNPISVSGGKLHQASDRRLVLSSLLNRCRHHRALRNAEDDHQRQRRAITQQLQHLQVHSHQKQNRPDMITILSTSSL